MLLADVTLRGEVALDDQLSRHLPAPHPAWRHREPTLLELATHRSGLPNTPRAMGRRELLYALGFGGDADPWARVSEAEYGSLVEAESPRRPPGGRMRYSSVGFGMLGDALAARAGTAYEELLRDRVLAPLGMDSTAIAVGEAAPRPLTPRAAAAADRGLHADGRQPALERARHPALPGRVPGASRGRAGRALGLAQEPHTRAGRRLEIGLGWIIVSRPKHPRVVWHNGGTWGFRSFAGFAPERRSAAVVLSNAARSVDRLGFRLIESSTFGEEDGRPRH